MRRSKLVLFELEKASLTVSRLADSNWRVAHMKPNLDRQVSLLASKRVDYHVSTCVRSTCHSYSGNRTATFEQKPAHVNRTFD